MDNTKIIVVEDNIVYCEFVCNLLAREGFRTVQAFHLSTAKKYLQQAADGDIVVSDLRLPDGGKHETWFAGLHTQAACGGQTRSSATYHIERTAHRTKPYAPVLA